MQEVFGQGFHVSFEWIDLQHLDENIGPTLQQAVQSSSPLKGPMDSHARIEEQAFVQAENLLKILDAKVLSAHHREQILQHKSKGSSIFVLFHKKSNDLRWGGASQNHPWGHLTWPHPILRGFGLEQLFREHLWLQQLQTLPDVICPWVAV